MVKFQLLTIHPIAFSLRLILCDIIFLFFSFKKSSSQDFKGKNYHIKNSRLGEYYQNSVSDNTKPGVKYPQPWLLLIPWINDLTESATMGVRIYHSDINARDANIVKPRLSHLPGMHVFEKKMLETAIIGYSCLTELSNYITRRCGIDYRNSHDLVNLFVKESSIKRIPSKEADINIFHKFSKEFLEKTLDITEKELRLSLDPVKLYYGNKQLGSSSFG